MNETIKQATDAEFSSRYLQWLFSLTIAFLLFLFVIQPTMYSFGHQDSTVLMPATSIAGRITVGHGIDEFTGRPLHMITSSESTSALLSLILFLIVGPTLLLNYAFPDAKKPSPDSSTFSVTAFLRTLVMLAAVIVTGMSVFYSTLISFQASAAFKTMRSDNDVSEARDRLTNELSKAYPAIVSHYYSQKNSKENGHPATLSEMGIESKTPFGELILKPSINEFTVSIVAVGYQDGNEITTFQNENGSKGRIQYQMDVYPANPQLTIIREN